MSGTSMAAAVVSGAVALLLDGDAELTPLQVKLALQASADFMPEAGLLAAGAGQLDLEDLDQLPELTRDTPKVIRPGSRIRFQKPTVWSRKSSSGATSSFGATDPLGRFNPLGRHDPLGRRHPLGRCAFSGAIVDLSGAMSYLWGDIILWGRLPTNAEDVILWGDVIFWGD